MLEWIVPRASAIAPGFEVRRSLPFKGGRGVGPFVFLDHMGPHRLPAGARMDVAPHPHIGLSTLTYLFEGEALHRDSLGTVQKISPLEVNWMTAGHGIVHSERTPEEWVAKEKSLHGLQAWVALPKDRELCEPSFEHVPKERLPLVTGQGATYRVIVGQALGVSSPVTTHLRMFYIHSQFEKGHEADLSFSDQEVALYLVSGSVEVDGARYPGPGLLIFPPGRPVRFQASEATEAMLLGGEPLQEHRTIWWNFVATDKSLIEQAKRRWRTGGFPQVPGESTFIPLPE